MTEGRNHRLFENPEKDDPVGESDANDEGHRSRNMPDRPIRPPADRHYISRINRRIKPALRTTFITSAVDVGRDLAMIRQGQAKRNGEYYTVNGRTWFHEDGGRVFPVSGQGLVGPVSRGVIHALKAYARYNGINDLSDYEITMNDACSDQDREEARTIWNLREQRR